MMNDGTSGAPPQQREPACNTPRFGHARGAGRGRSGIFTAAHYH